MITNSILSSLLSNHTTSSKGRSSISESKSSYSSFDTILSSSIGKKSSTEDIPVNSNKPVKTFRQIDKSKINITKKETSKPKEASNDDDKVTKDDKKSNNTKEKAVVKAIAELLGVSTEELENILKQCDVKASDLVDPSSCALAVSKISDMLKLSSEQKESFADAVMKINEIVNSYAGQIIAQSKDKSDWVKVEGLNVEVVDETESDVNQVEKVIETKLEQLVKDLKKNNEASFDSISLKANEAYEEIIDEKQAEEAKKDISNEQLEASGDANEQAAGSTAPTIPSASSGSIMTNITAESEVDQNSEVAIVNSIGSSDTHKGIDSLKTIDANSNVKVVRNEIMNQVIEKAKVILDGQKSEMVMELKPESLGKLALKVVTENGIVMAKFVAENQQVKEVLETNMQLLKDSLEKQGMNIQGFSVSVGQESKKEADFGGDFGKRKNSQSRSSAEIGSINGAVVQGDTEISNPYTIKESSVDFKA